MLARLAPVAVAILATAFLAPFIGERGEFDGASAQVQPTVAASSVIPLPPPAPGVDYSPLMPSHVEIPTAAAAGTPMASDPGTAPAGGNSVTASLGGSDVAVSSVGGSYERDVPKKRGKRDSRR